MDNAAEVARYICKIHIPATEEDRVACLRTLKMMNLHHGTLFPDAIGASRFCNEWVGSQEIGSTETEKEDQSNIRSGETTRRPTGPTVGAEGQNLVRLSKNWLLASWT